MEFHEEKSSNYPQPFTMVKFRAHVGDSGKKRDHGVRLLDHNLREENCDLYRGKFFTTRLRTMSCP